MRGNGLVGGYRIVGAALIVVAVACQVVVDVRGGGFRAQNFFSFFTVCSSLLAAVALSVAALAPASRRVDLLRGAAVVYMVTTFVVVAVLVPRADQPVAVPWVDVVVHRVMPVVVALDWLLVPPGRHLGLDRCRLWLAFPMVWLAYTMIRGPIAGWYPYSFLDPGRSGGYGAVAETLVGSGLGMVVLTLIVSWLGNRGWSRRLRR